MKRFLKSIGFLSLFVAAPVMADDNSLNINKSAEKKEELRAGVGFGIPYGILGANLEARPIDYFALSAGLGYALGEPGWSFGGRVYPIGKSHLANPRLSVYYGTVAVLENWDGTKDTQSGIAYGLGLDMRPVRSLGGSFDFEVIYISTDTRAGYVRKDGGDVKFSLGYGYNF